MVRPCIRFFTALLCLAAACCAVPGRANAQATPAVSAVAQPGEVAILTGVLPSGATIPLPTYSDGTSALESECHWFVSINSVAADAGSARLQKCFAQGRVVTAYWCLQVDCGSTFDPYYATVNYMIIAVRSGAPVGSPGSTWGQLKARYR